MAGRMRNYAARNPTATVSGATGIVVAGIVAIADRLGIVLGASEVALLVLVVGWVPVAARWLLDRREAKEEGI